MATSAVGENHEVGGRRYCVSWGTNPLSPVSTSPIVAPTCRISETLSSCQKKLHRFYISNWALVSISNLVVVPRDSFSDVWEAILGPYWPGVVRRRQRLGRTTLALVASRSRRPSHGTCKMCARDGRTVYFRLRTKEITNTSRNRWAVNLLPE